MSTITFDELFSRFYTKVEAYDLFSEAMDDKAKNEFLCSYVHISISKPYVARLFSILNATDSYYDDNDEYVDGFLNYELKKPIEDGIDDSFVLEVVSMGMALAWVDPKVSSLENMKFMVGTSNEKYYSQSAHLTGLISLQKHLDVEQRMLITDRGSYKNSYLDGLMSRKN